MKKFFRLFVVTLAAVFAFTACDSSGGGEEQLQPQSVSYSGKTADNKPITLTLTQAVATRQASGGQRVPYAFTDGGTYTLHVDNVLVSSGNFSASGDSLTFASTAGKTFSASAEGNTPPVFNEAAIPLDTGDPLPRPAMYNAESFEIQVYKPDGSAYDGPDVTLKGFMSDQNDRAGNKYLSGDPIGTITGGKLTLNLKALKNDDLFDVGDFFIGGLGFTVGADVIDLSLQGAQKRESFGLEYLSELFISEDTGSVYEKGWNYSVEGDAWEGSQPHSLKWFMDRGYKWVYNANPLEGTWTTPSGIDFSGTLTFTGDSYEWTTDRGFSSSGTFKAAGYSIEFDPDEEGDTTWTQEFSIGGNSLTMQTDEDNEWGRTRGNYLRK